MIRTRGSANWSAPTLFPRAPLGFHGDADGTRFHAAYFAQNPGFWTHGDLIEATPQGGWRLHGRSDGVLNVRGIRIGTAEIYRILGAIEEIREAMAVEQQAEASACWASRPSAGPTIF
jgi:acetoacetyl-CoA synthetase